MLKLEETEPDNDAEATDRLGEIEAEGVDGL